MNDDQHKQDSKLKNQSNQINGIAKGEQKSNSYQNENQKRSVDDDLDENEVNYYENKEEDNDVEDKDLDKNGFPRS